MKFITAVIFAVILTGCTSPGPMQKYNGPINTPVFDYIALGISDDGSKKILFKEDFVYLYEDEEMESMLAGTFFVTEHNAFMAYWWPSKFNYDITYRLKGSDIKGISSSSVERLAWSDSDLIVITDRFNKKTGFSIEKKNAAISALRQIQENSQH